LVGVEQGACVVRPGSDGEGVRDADDSGGLCGFERGSVSELAVVIASPATDGSALMERTGMKAIDRNGNGIGEPNDTGRLPNGLGIARPKLT
jgi:hypothetical protein